MNDRICVHDLLKLYQELYNRFLDWLNNSQYYIYSSKRVGRKVIVSLLVLTCCIRPSWFKELVIDPWRGVCRYRGHVVELRDSYLQLFVRNWYLPKYVDYLFPSYIYDPDLHKLSEREVRRIVKGVLGVSPKLARLACAAKISCERGIREAARYYGTPTWYLKKVLNAKTGQLEN